MDNNIVTKREVCFLIGVSDEVIYADYSESATALPDACKRWKNIWDNRDSLVEIAHSHPLGGSNFSREDETTMQALLKALGRDIRFSVVAPNEMRLRAGAAESIVAIEPWWADVMRLASGNLPLNQCTREQKEG